MDMSVRNVFDTTSSEWFGFLGRIQYPSADGADKGSGTVIAARVNPPDPNLPLLPYGAPPPHVEKHELLPKPPKPRKPIKAPPTIPMGKPPLLPKDTAKIDLLRRCRVLDREIERERRLVAALLSISGFGFFASGGLSVAGASDAFGYSHGWLGEHTAAKGLAGGAVAGFVGERLLRFSMLHEDRRADAAREFGELQCRGVLDEAMGAAPEKETDRASVPMKRELLLPDGAAIPAVDASQDDGFLKLGAGAALGIGGAYLLYKLARTVAATSVLGPVGFTASIVAP